MNATVKGRYRFEVYRPDGTSRLPLGDTWVDNVITNAGLAALFSQAQAVGSSDVINGSGFGFLVPMTWCRLSGSAQSIDPTVATLSAQAAESARYIKSFPTITHNPPTVDYPDTVNQATYSSDATWIWAVLQRTFVFPPSGVDRNWNGAAVSHTAISSDPVFSRVNPGATVTVGGGEELRVIFQLTVKIPKVAVSVALSGGGFDATGNIKVVGSPAVIFGGINPDGTQSGATTANTLPHILRGGGVATGGYLLSNSAFPADNTDITPTYAGVSQADSLTTSITQGDVVESPSGTFTRITTLVWSFGRPVASENDVRTIFLGTALAPTVGIQWLLNANQTKDPTKTLSATFSIAWTRP